MKHTLHLILIPLILIICLALAFTFTPDSIRNAFLSKIPFFNRFVQTNSYSRLAGITSENMAELETARFSVDFLMHLKKDDKHYIAVYPYTVTARFPNDFTVSSQDNISATNLTVTIPTPKIQAFASAKDKVMVIKDTLEEASWNANVQPVKDAFEMRACDIAIKSGIYKKSVDNLKDYLSNLYSTTNIDISFDTDIEKSILEEGNLERIEAQYLPIAFETKTLPFQKTENDFLSRDDSFYTVTSTENATSSTGTAIRIGLTKEGSYQAGIDSWFSREELKDRLVLLYRDPSSIESKAVLSYADNLFRTSEILLSDTEGTLVYVESSVPNDQIQMDYVASRSLYLAMSAVSSSTEKKDVLSYYNFSTLYDLAFDALKKGSYSILTNYLNSMKTLNENLGFTTINPDLTTLDAVTAMLYRKTQLSTGIPLLDTWMEISQALTNNDFEHMDEQFRQKALAIFESLPQSRLSLKSYFLQNSDVLKLEQYEIDSYIDDISQNGNIINKDLFKSLNGQTRSRYLQEIFRLRLDDVVIETNKDDTFILAGGTFDALYNKKNKGPDYIREKLNREAHADSIYLVFPENNFFLDDYQVILFGFDGIEFFDDITSIFGTKGVFLPYSEITIYGNGYFGIGKKSFNDITLQNILSELQRLFTNDNTYTLKITNDIESYLKNYIATIMERP